MEDKTILGQNIKFYRERIGTSQEELAHELGFSSRATIGNWESGYTNPDATLLPDIASLLQVSVDDLFFGTIRMTDRTQASEDGDQSHMDEIKRYLSRLEKLTLEEANSIKKAITQVINAREEENRRRLQLAKGAQIIFPLFLSEEDDDYLTMHEKMKDLRKLRRKNSYSYADLRERMNLIDSRYNEHICLAFYYLMFTGEKVPSPELFEVMKSILMIPKK